MRAGTTPPRLDGASGHGADDTGAVAPDGAVPWSIHYNRCLNEKDEKGMTVMTPRTNAFHRKVWSAARA